MKLVYITCVLFATAICCIAADNATTTQGDTKSINQQIVDLVNSTAPIKNSSSPTVSVKDSNTNITRNANDSTTSTVATIPDATNNNTTGNKTKDNTTPVNDHGTESTTSATTTTTLTSTTLSTTTKQTSTPEKSTPTTIVISTTTSNTTPIVSSTPITTVGPASTKVAPPYKERQFDGLSFLGGIILATCLMAIGVLSWKFYRTFNEQNYRTL